MEHPSRGMQQRIALARALLTSPILMLPDEPEALKRRYAFADEGHLPTLEETFTTATGLSVDEASAEEE